MNQAGFTIAISTGTRNILFGLFAGDKFLSKWRVETRVGRTADEYGSWLLSILAHVDVNPKLVKAVVIGNVVPQVETVLLSMVRRFFHVEPLLIQPGVKTGIQINYGQGNVLGADRVANMVAAHKMYNEPIMAIDFGSITSIDVIDEKGHYLGGVVAPGVMLSLDTLAEVAPSLPQVSFQQSPKVLGKNTADSMRSGCYWGAVAMVEGLTARIWDELGVTGKIVATGGFAQDIQDKLTVDEVDSNLTLKGLKYILDKSSATTHK